MTDRREPRRPKTIAFDIIGTVFEVSPLRPKVLALGLEGSALEGWMAAADRDAASMAAAGDYQPFAEVAKGALDAVLAEQTLDPPASDKQALLDAMADMAPRAGADTAFAAARDVDISIMALTNGSAEATRKLLDRAGLLPFFKHVVSTDDVRLAKPRLEVYRRACDVAKLEPIELALIAAHPWDIQGAIAAGLTTAYLTADRPYSPAMRHPDLRSDTLLGCVRALATL